MEVIRTGHFSLWSGLHTDTFIDASAIDPDKMTRIAATVAAAYQHMNIQVVIGVPNGGNAFAAAIAYNLRYPVAARVVRLIKIGPVQFLKKTIGNSLRGQRVLVVEDVLTTGSSVRLTLDQLSIYRAHVVGVCALFGRGNVTALDLRVPILNIIHSVKVEQWALSQCPLCPAPLDEC